MLIQNLLAKSGNNVKLLNHSKNIGFVAEYIYKKINICYDENLSTTIRVGGYLHDIGKCREELQSLFNGKKKVKSSNKYTHNEYGWAFVEKYIKYDVSYFVYWHHGISNKLNVDDSETILSYLSDVEIERMKEFSIAVLGNDCFKNEVGGNKKTPKFYNIENNKIYRDIFIRTCIISADRIISSIEDIYPNLIITEDNISEYIDNILDDIMLKSSDWVVKESFNLNKERLGEQKNIISQCSDTTIIKAPAGFGKTMLGILWSLQNNKKTIWVCPRNVVSKSIYDTILKDLKLLGLNNVSVELYLTNSVEDSNTNNHEFSSDIIITNIDNFLAPSIKDNILINKKSIEFISDNIRDSVGKRLLLLNSANVVFDEYHELITSNNAIFSCFVEIMKSRNLLGKCKTLLLSATPIILDDVIGWDSMTRKTTILPNRETHYPAAHKTPYKIKVHDDFELPRELELNSNVIIFNSIGEAQRFKCIYYNSELYHSEFDSKTRKEKYEFIIGNFGKDRKNNHPKQTVISTLIMQASFNVTFKNLAESIQSPEATLQRIGRCNRFDDYDKETKSIIYIFKLKNRNPNVKELYSKSEIGANEIFYDKNLTKLWYDELDKYNNDELTLDELYNIYNKHIIEYNTERNKFFKLRYLASQKLLESVYPKRYFGKKNVDEKPIYTAGSNKLRAIGNEIFFIARKFGNPNEYSDVFSTEIRKNIADDFHEDKMGGKIYYEIIKSFKSINNSGDERFDYSDILNDEKYMTIDKIREYARKSNTPYIRFDLVYHDIYGLISEEKLYEFNIK